MSENPYSAPESSVETHTDPQGFELHPPRTVGIGRGVGWIADGFGHFKQDPGPWILICIVGFVIMLVTSIIPFLSIIMMLFTYVWIGGLMLGCKAQDDGEGIQVSHLFAGWQKSVGPLILLGLIFMVVYIAIMAVALGSMFATIMGLGSDMEAAMPEDILSSIVLPVLIAMLFAIPLSMAVWFAPALIVINDVPVFKAMGMSFMGCLKNIVPFLIYGILMMLISFIAILPIGLGLLIFMPMAFGGLYRAYKDIFIEA